MDEQYQISPVAHISTDFPEKFGLPRQSGLVPALRGRIVFTPEFRRAEAVRELDGFSHIWVIWRFTLCADGGWSPTVRPPRLGGNRRVGVFASRSPFRPNGLGLSCLRLDGIDLESPDAPALLVSGVDMLDGTPVYDIKPYIPLSDLRPDAAEGYTALTRVHRLSVAFAPGLEAVLPPDKLAALTGVLENDPRPGYGDDPQKAYGLTFAGYDAGFRVDGEKLTVFRLCRIENGTAEPEKGA